MKSLLLTIVLTGILGSSYAQDTGIQFENNLTWGQVLKKAKAEHKYIFVDCYATWCGPCKVMDQKVYPDKSVGEVYNKDFISIKLQMDKTSNDDEHTKQWYLLAKKFSQDYSVNAYPTFLFFDEKGNALHKITATRSVQAFIQLAADAKDPDKQYYSLVKHFEPGKLDTAEEKSLARMFSYSDKVLAGKMALDYITRIPKKAWKDSANLVFIEGFYKDSLIKQKAKKYIDHLSDKEMYANANMILFVSTFTDKPSDKSFDIFYHHGDKIDDVVKTKRYAKGVVERIIYKHELGQVIDAAKQNNKEPDWNSVSNAITKRFGKEYIARVIPKAKMDWYEYKKEDENFCASLIVWFESVEDIAKDLSDSTGNVSALNSVAWEIFQKSNDKASLEKALYWAALITDATTEKFGYASNIIDTRANLLYKLGRTKDAIEWEEKALKIQPGKKDVIENLQKMKEGKPTW